MQQENTKKEVNFEIEETDLPEGPKQLKKLKKSNF